MICHSKKGLPLGSSITNNSKYTLMGWFEEPMAHYKVHSGQGEYGFIPFLDVRIERTNRILKTCTQRKATNTQNKRSNRILKISVYR